MNKDGSTTKDGVKDITIKAEYRETISRLFVFRGLWMFVMIWPLWVWMIWISIIYFLQFWYQLFLGKRHQGFWNKQLRFFRHITKWNSYLNLITDKRPKFIED